MPEPGVPGRIRGEARNELIRAEIEPLAPGERPTAVAIGAIVALVFGIANLVLFAAGYDLRGEHARNAAGAIVFAILMFGASGGMWQVRAWAVLGFQALLAVTAIFAALALLVASNLQAVLLCLVVMATTGTLFWHLVRALRRIQSPDSVNNHYG